MKKYHKEFKMGIQLQIGNNAISSYKRLAYTPWHAIAEFIDNATQSYFDNKKALDESAGKIKPPLIVTIEYDLDNGVFRVTDNAMGMSYEELEKALIVANPPKNTSGRSKYGMGLKTAACWIGNFWTVKTKKLGETVEHLIEVDVEKIANGDNNLKYESRKKLPKETHYTIIEIKDHNRKFKGQTLGKIERFLGSMYRQDFRTQTMTLIWRGRELTWAEFDDRLLKAKDGNTYKKTFDFNIEEDGSTKRVTGWVGVLKEGSRSNAGFSILHSGRVVRGWPDSWRPETLYGQEQGSNDLVNQRLVGEIYLDDFDVSHTKDDILWLGEQEELVQEKLLETCQDYKEVAKTYRKGKDDLRKPSDLDTDAAVSALQKELESKEVKDILTTNPMLTKDLIENLFKSVEDYVTIKYQARFSIKIIEGLTVKVFIESDMSIAEPYVVIDSAKIDEVVVIINAAHPHWNQLDSASSILNYLRHCIYDGVAEWQARKFVGDLNPNTIKILKDRLLRLPLDIENNQNLN